MTIGRTAAATRRDGFLGFQERLTDEVLSAIFWLQGVKGLKNIFEKRLKPWIFPNSEHLSTEIAWTQPWGKRTHVDLTAQELFTRNATELKTLLRMKSLGLITRVGITLAMVAYIIPKLNVLKTDWVLKHFYSKKQQPPAQPSAPSTISQGAMPPESNPAWKSPAPASTPSSSAFPMNALNPSVSTPAVPTPAPIQLPANASPTFPIQHPAPAFPYAGYPFAVNAPATFPANPIQNSAAIPPVPITSRPGTSPETQHTATPLQFGRVPFSPLLQGLGHMVDQTAYGSILVVDTGITGGRSYVAYKREPYEMPEKIFQEVASLYLYILAQPHLQKLMSKVIDRALGTHMRMEPEIAEAMNRQIALRLAELSQYRPDLQAALKRGEVPKDVLEEVITGATRYQQQLLKPAGWLAQASRLAPAETEHGFLPLLEKEAAAIFGNPAQGAAYRGQVAHFLRGKLDGKVSTEDIATLLDAIDSGKGAFQALNIMERTNLTMTVKHAFRHTVGLPLNLSEAGIRSLPPLQETLKTLPEAEQRMLIARLQRMARIDAMNQANTMLRRGLILARPHIDPAQLKLAQSLADWLDTAVHSHLTLEEKLTRDLNLISERVGDMKLPQALKTRFTKPQSIQPDDLRQLSEALGQLNGWWGRKSRQAFQTQVNHLHELLSDLQPGEAMAERAKANILTRFQTLIRHLKPGTPAEIKNLLVHYQGQSPELLDGKQGRLFSTEVAQGQEALDLKLKGMLLGGLQHDSAFVRQAQQLLDQFQPASRAYHASSKSAAMSEAVTTYSNRLLAKVKATTGSHLPAWEDALKEFFLLNRNLNYATRTISMITAMLALGIVVPKIQFAITRKLTGRNENPGIARAKQAAGMAGGGKKPGPATVPNTLNGPALNRNHFQAFNHSA